MPSAAHGVILTAVGDINAQEVQEINRVPGTNPRSVAERFNFVRPIFQAADIAFGNLEQVLTTVREVTDATAENDNFGPGTLPLDPKEGARVLEEAGFDVMSFANNHVMDFGSEALLASRDAVHENTNVKLVGSGATIEEARQPVIIERKGMTFGFLGYSSQLPRWHWAGVRKTRNGTPIPHAGSAPLRAHTAFEQLDYQPGNGPKVHTFVEPLDLAAMLDDVRNLRDQVDFVVTSIHWGIHLNPGVIAEYQVEAGHAAIDAGVDLILGHGCNMLKGVEFYQSKPIIYSMPTANTATKSGKKYDPSSHPTGGERTEFQNAGIMKVEFRDKKLQRVSMVPCDIENTRLTLEPLPRSHPRSEVIREYLEWCCENNSQPGNHYAIGAQRDFPPFATDSTWDGDEIVITPREDA